LGEDFRIDTVAVSLFQFSESIGAVIQHNVSIRMSSRESRDIKFLVVTVVGVKPGRVAVILKPVEDVGKAKQEVLV